MIPQHKPIVIILTIILIWCQSCSNSLSQLDPEQTNSAADGTYWRIQELDPEGSLSIIKVAGSYEEIGHLLGEWYKDHGFISRLLSEEEKEDAASLISFYEAVDPKIVDQMRGMYTAFDLDFDNIKEGIPISEVDGREILIPGLINLHSCSVLFARPEITSDNHARLGRNYDYPEEIQDLTLLFTFPEGGYPTAILTPRLPGLTAADGINSQGLALGFASVADLGYATPAGETLISSFAYRYVLEHSANVDEAIHLLMSIPISFIPSTPEGIITHLLLADKSGDSAVVEFLPEGVVANKSAEPFQIMTNNLWVDREERKSCQRYCLAEDRLGHDSGNINSDTLMTVLSELRGSTQYSVIYDLQNLTLLLSLRSSDYSIDHEYSLLEFINQMDNIGK